MLFERRSVQESAALFALARSASEAEGTLVSHPSPSSLANHLPWTLGGIRRPNRKHVDSCRTGEAFATPAREYRALAGDTEDPNGALGGLRRRTELSVRRRSRWDRKP